MQQFSAVFSLFQDCEKVAPKRRGIFSPNNNSCMIEYIHVWVWVSEQKRADFLRKSPLADVKSAKIWRKQKFHME